MCLYQSFCGNVWCRTGIFAGDSRSGCGAGRWTGKKYGTAAWKLAADRMCRDCCRLYTVIMERSIGDREKNVGKRDHDNGRVGKGGCI